MIRYLLETLDLFLAYTSISAAWIARLVGPLCKPRFGDSCRLCNVLLNIVTLPFLCINFVCFEVAYRINDYRLGLFQIPFGPEYTGLLLQQAHLLADEYLILAGSNSAVDEIKMVERGFDKLPNIEE